MRSTGQEPSALLKISFHFIEPRYEITFLLSNPVINFLRSCISKPIKLVLPFAKQLVQADRLKNATNGVGLDHRGNVSLVNNRSAYFLSNITERVLMDVGLDGALDGLAFDKFDGVLTNRFRPFTSRPRHQYDQEAPLLPGQSSAGSIIDCPCVVEPGFADTNIHGKTACRLHSKSGSE